MSTNEMAATRSIELDTIHLQGKGVVALHHQGAPITISLGMSRDLIGHTFYLVMQYITKTGAAHQVDSHELDMVSHNAGIERDDDLNLTNVLFNVIAFGELDAEALDLIRLMLDRYWAATPDHAPAFSA